MRALGKVLVGVLLLIVVPVYLICDFLLGCLGWLLAAPIHLVRFLHDIGGEFTTELVTMWRIEQAKHRIQDGR